MTEKQRQRNKYHWSDDCKHQPPCRHIVEHEKRNGDALGEAIAAARRGILDG